LPKKINNNRLFQPESHPLERGFDTFYGFLSAQINYYNHTNDYFRGFEPGKKNNVANKMSPQKCKGTFASD
jgi:hypothetical protein